MSGHLRADPPELSHVVPSGVPPGSTVEMQLFGDHLASATSLWSNASIPSQLMNSDMAEGKEKVATFRVSVPSEQKVGVVACRIVSADGVSNLRLLLIDDLPADREQGTNKSPNTAQFLEIPRAVDGASESRSYDFYRFSARKGQKLSLEVYARRLGSPMDPFMRILDSDGQELDYSDDEPGLEGDCRLRFSVSNDGDYFVELRDIRYDGGDDYRYRLRIADFPLVSAGFPLGVQRGSMTEVEFCGPAVDGPPSDRLAIPADYPHEMMKAAARFGDGPRVSADFQISDGPELVEFEPNDKAEVGNQVPIPAVINGKLHTPGDQDQFLFNAKKDQRLRFEAHTRELGSPADLYMRLYGNDGKLLKDVDDSDKNEGSFDYSFPADGEYRLQVEDLVQAGGSGYVYRIEIRPYVPRFSLEVESDLFNTPSGGVFLVKVTAVRDGYEGSIELSVEGLPSSTTIQGTTIGAKEKESTLRIALPKDSAAGQLKEFRVVGTGNWNGREFTVAANATSALRSHLSNMRFPPHDIRQTLVLGVGPKFPQFFQLSIDEPAVEFPQLVGQAKFTITAKRTHGFEGDIDIHITGLPPSFSVNADAINKENEKVELTIDGPPNALLAEYRFKIVGTATHENQPGTFEIDNAILRVVPPIAVECNNQIQLAAGSTEFVDVRVKSFAELKNDIALTWHNLPRGVSASAETSPPGNADVRVTFAAAKDALPGSFDGVRLTAKANVHGRSVTAVSELITLVVTQPE